MRDRGQCATNRGIRIVARDRGADAEFAERNKTVRGLVENALELFDIRTVKCCAGSDLAET
jgi:hypothetical protein